MARYNPEDKRLNFRDLYNKSYGDIFAKTSHAVITPEMLFNMACKYFEWAEKTSIEVAESTAYQGSISEHKVHKHRIFTSVGMRLFVGVSEAQLAAWRKEPHYCEVMSFIDGVIFEQKYQLAANNVINASFIGKEIGIDSAPSVVVENNNTNTGIEKVTSDEVKDAVRDVLKEI